MDKLNVRLSECPDFKMEAIISLYDRQWNKAREVSESDLKYGKGKDEMKNEFKKLCLFRNSVIEDIEKSDLDIAFLDRFVFPDSEECPFLLNLYFYSGKRLGEPFTETETDELISGFVVSWVNDILEKQTVTAVSDIGELYRLLDDPSMTTEKKMLILDTYANRHRLMACLREYISTVVPIMEKHFPIIKEEFDRYYREYSEIDDWTEFYNYFSIEFDKRIEVLDTSLSILLFDRLLVIEIPSDYSMIGMRYRELKEWERLALISNGVLLEYLKAISDGTRLKILNELKQKKMRVKDLAAALSLTAPTISHHISILLRLGIVSAFMSNTELAAVEYKVNASRIDDICGLLAKLK